MTKGLSMAPKAALGIVAFFLAASLATVAHAEDKAQLSGHWSFNQDQSDDSNQKVEEAQQNSKVRQGSTDSAPYPGAGGGTYPGGGGMGGMGRMGIPGIGGGGGMGGGMGRGRQSSNRGEAISSEDWDRVAANPKYLRIDQRSDQIVITDDSDHAQTFYPDGKKHEDKDADGKKFSTKTSWDDDALVAESKLPHSEKLTQTFRVSDGGKQLTVISRFEAAGLNAPVIIRRVYDMQPSPSE